MSSDNTSFTSKENRLTSYIISIALAIAVFLILISCYRFFDISNCCGDNTTANYNPAPMCCHLSIDGEKCDRTRVSFAEGSTPSYLSSIIPPNSISYKDMHIADIAWTYFENNTQKTGLVNSVNKYTSTTMWDTGSAIAGIITARELCMISQKEFDDIIVPLLATLKEFELYHEIAPNKAYNTVSGKMVDYRNKPTKDGIGISTLDLARLVSWLNILSVAHPKYTNIAREVIKRWDYSMLIKDCQMFGYANDPVTKDPIPLQEGRLGYEQYAGKVFDRFGFNVDISKDYNNKFAEVAMIYGIPIPYDRRDPRELGAYNYVVTESFAMDIFENGKDEVNGLHMDNIYEVQRQRWLREGIITAVSEDNIDRKPYFIYNTIFAVGLPWNTITDRGVIHNNLKSTSTKAALSMVTLYPDHPYSETLYSTIESAYHPDKGWYSGVFENGMGFNKAITANTNGIVLETIFYKMYGSLKGNECALCRDGRSFASEVMKTNTGCGQCSDCGNCEQTSSSCTL